MDGLDLLAQASSKRSSSLVEAQRLIGPQLAQVRNLYKQAAESSGVVRKQLMSHSEDLWTKAEGIREEMLQQEPVDDKLLKKLREEVQEEGALKSQLEAEVDFLSSKIDQLKEVIKEETQGSDSK